MNPRGAAPTTGAAPPAPQRVARRFELFLLDRFLPLFLLDLLAGTLPPALRASERPIAIACLRLLTFFFERPERSEPLFISDIARSTLLEAFLPYRFFDDFFLLVAIAPARSNLHASSRAGELTSS